MPNVRQRKCLVVLGMHRSGTSAVAGVLHLLGMDLGKDVMPPVEGNNPKGFFENRKIYWINEAILESLHSTWDDQLLLPENWWEQENLSIHKQNAIETLQAEFNDNELFGIKDPRLCLLLPFWQQIFEELHITPYYLIIVRNPLEIAASLARREGFSVEKSVILWMHSMLSAELYSRNHPRVFISFDGLLKNASETITFISDALSLNFPENFQDIKHTINKFLSPNLKHHNIADKPVNKRLLSFMSKYDAILQSFVNNPDIPRKELRKIDRVRSSYYHEATWFYNEDLQDTVKTLKKKEHVFHEKEEEIQRLRPHYYTQLYVDTGAGFYEEQSIIQQITGIETQLEFELSDYNNIIGLRFDPVNSRTVLRLDQIKILTANNILHSEVTYQTNALYQKNDRLIFETHDPIIKIDTIDIVKPKTVVIRVNYLSWGPETYKYISEEKSSIIKVKDEQIYRQAEVLQGKDAELHRQVEALQAKDAELHRQTEVLQAKDAELHRQTEVLQAKDAELHRQTEVLQAQDAELQQKIQLIQAMENTMAWKITKPLGKILDKIKLITGKKGAIIIHVDHVNLFSDRLDVSGWAISQRKREQIERIQVYIDERFIGNAGCGQPRPDVERVYPDIPGSSEAGFRFAVSLEGFSYDREEHTVVIRTISRKGRQIEATETVRMTPRTLISCDRMELSTDALDVAGWVLSDEGIERVEVYLDNVLIGNADYGYSRPDVASAYPSVKDSRDSGFDFYLELEEKIPKLNVGEHKVAIKAIDKDGQNFETERTVDVKKDITEEFVKLADLKLKTFLETPNEILFPKFENPLITIILVLFNRSELTLQCLESIKAHTTNISYEIVIIDNASSDETPDLLEKLKNVTIMKNIENVGFLKACNQAVDHAQGKYVLFLNNDTQVLANTFSALVNTIETHPKTGAVGGKLIFPDGRLQEAGSIIWQDGSCIGYGRDDDPFKPEYSYLREVYYCSGALLLTPRQLFVESGKFDERYAPAYSEEADYCMRVREKGYKVLYQPLAQIIHHEFASSEQSEKAITLQLRNRRTFKKKWSRTLSTYYAAQQKNMLFARACDKNKRRVLFIDDLIPDPKLGNGFPRSFDILNVLVQLGYQVTFFPLQAPEKPESETMYFQQKGVEVIYAHTGTKYKLSLKKFLKNRQTYYDILLVSRPHNMEEISRLTEMFDGKMKVVYDCEALFTTREVLYKELTKEEVSEEEKEHLIKKEIDLAKKAHSVIAVSAQEKEQFEQHGIHGVHIVGHSIEANPTPNLFEERQDLLFVGGILGSPSPNEDAVLYFAEEIYPYIYEKTRAKLYLVGSNKSRRVWGLQSKNIIVTGRVESIVEYYNTCKIFVVPTRYAAGLPYKLHYASSYGIPAVVTPLIAEELDWQEGESLLVGRDSQDFAEKCIELYTNQDLWKTIRSGAIEMVERDCSPQVFKDNLYKALEK